MILTHYPNLPNKGKTSGWVEENMFHPADIVSALTGITFAPNRAIGLTELVTYVLGEGRNSHANEKGEIMGFFFNVALTRLPRALPEIKKQFPEINTFVESLDKEELKAKCGDAKYEQQFIKSLVDKFGKEVAVIPILNKSKVSQESSDSDNIEITVFKKSKL